jgi:hypothetical protein
MAYGFAKHGIVNPTSRPRTRGFFLFAKVHPYSSDRDPDGIHQCRMAPRRERVARQRFELIKTRAEDGRGAEARRLAVHSSLAHTLAFQGLAQDELHRDLSLARSLQRRVDRDRLSDACRWRAPFEERMDPRLELCDEPGALAASA